MNSILNEICDDLSQSIDIKIYSEFRELINGNLHLFLQVKIQMNLFQIDLDQ